MDDSFLTINDLFQLLEPKGSIAEFATKFQILVAYEFCSKRPSVGKDGVKWNVFSRNKEFEIDLIYKRLNGGSYKFTPYLEKLIPKGHDSLPRRIAIPTLRDKVALKVIHNFLKQLYGDDYRRKHQLSVIDTIKSNISDYKYFARFDLSGFYDTIPHESLIRVMSYKIKDESTLKIIRHAINNNISPLNKKTPLIYENIGIPQGLSISNLLSNVYAQAIDDAMIEFNYYRYVDDILFLSNSEIELDRINLEMLSIVNKLGLKLNDSKYQTGTTLGGFEYLGYYYQDGKWSIKQDTLERQFRALHGIFTRLKYELAEQRQGKKRTSKKILYARFVDDLNNRITGAIYKGNKHGFTFYFSKITSVSQLHQLDAFVHENLREFKGLESKTNRVKTHVKGYYAWRSDNPEDYITEYGKEATTEEKFKYLADRDLLSGVAERYTAAYINTLYERYIRKKLRYIDEFTGTLS